MFSIMFKIDLDFILPLHCLSRSYVLERTGAGVVSLIAAGVLALVVYEILAS